MNCTGASDLQVHHVRPLRCFNGDTMAANQPENLVTLCRPCHVQADNEIRRSERA